MDLLGIYCLGFRQLLSSLLDLGMFSRTCGCQLGLQLCPPAFRFVLSLLTSTISQRCRSSGVC